jgi:ectoine hydroxylase-related dioxygenase (phytanoyl-CoA dioxygenase family)
MSTIDTLFERGLVVVRGLLEPAEVAGLRACFDALRGAGAPTTQQILYTHALPATPRPSYDRLFEQWFNPHTRDGDGSTRAWLEHLSDRLSDRLAPDLFAFQDMLLVKHAGHAALPWHQDEPFWPIDTPWAAIVWCALDPVDRERGGVELAVASHGRLGPAIDLHTGDPQLPDAAERFDEHAFERWCPALEPGDALIFHARTWHRSGINHTGLLRRAWISSWVPPEARWDPARAPRHPRADPLVAGTPVHPPVHPTRGESST